MTLKLNRRGLMAASIAAGMTLGAGASLAQDKLKLRLSSVNSVTDQRAALVPGAPLTSGIRKTVSYWDPDELGIPAERVPHLTSLRQLRPLESTQPWGIFFVSNLFFIGSNAAAETAPSYLSAADCGITVPTTT